MDKEGKSKIYRIEDTDGVDVDRQYGFAVIHHKDDYGWYNVGQIVPVEWEGSNRPREVGTGTKPGKLNAEFNIYEDFFEAVDAAREIQEEDALDKEEDKFDLRPDVEIQISRLPLPGTLEIRWTSKHRDIVSDAQTETLFVPLSENLYPEDKDEDEDQF